MILSLAFGLGFVHGFGADHMVAVAAFLGPRPSFRKAVLAGVKFGLGHSATLVVLGSLVLGTRLTLTGAFEHAANLTGGALMILIGAGLLLRLALSGHGHHHVHESRATGHGLTLASAVLALGGVRSYLVVLPLALEGSVTISVLAMLLFGAGVTVAMTVYGLAAAGLIRGAGRATPSILAVVGASSVAIGIREVLISWTICNVLHRQILPLDSPHRTGGRPSTRSLCSYERRL